MLHFSSTGRKWFLFTRLLLLVVVVTGGYIYLQGLYMNYLHVTGCWWLCKWIHSIDFNGIWDDALGSGGGRRGGAAWGWAVIILLCPNCCCVVSTLYSYTVSYCAVKHLVIHCLGNSNCWILSSTLPKDRANDDELKLILRNGNKLHHPLLNGTDQRRTDPLNANLR